MSKQLHISFNRGEKYKIPLTIIVSLIANKEFGGQIPKNLELYTKRIEELFKDEMLVFEKIWDIPWSVLEEYAVRVDAPDLTRDWATGEATVSVTE